MLPLSCWRSRSGVRMSGTRSRKYPVLGLPFTRTPTSRSRCTQRQTVERETPISLAIRSPLMAMVALLEKSASSDVSLRSVVPGREVEAMEAGRSLLVLDGVHKQAEIGGGSGMGERAGGEKIGAGFSVGTNVFKCNAAGDFHHAIRARLPSDVDAMLRVGRGHVVPEHPLLAHTNWIAHM